MKRKVEAWAVVFSEDEIYDRYGRHLARGKPNAMNIGDFTGKPKRVVRLVEHSSRESAVVRAARKAVASRARVSWGVRELDALVAAVERLEGKRK